MHLNTVHLKPLVISPTIHSSSSQTHATEFSDQGVFYLIEEQFRVDCMSIAKQMRRIRICVLHTVIE